MDTKQGALLPHSIRGSLRAEHTLEFGFAIKQLRLERGFWNVGPAVVDVTSPLQCAGLNRHEVEEVRALRERSSDPLGLESCAATARDTVKRR